MDCEVKSSSARTANDYVESWRRFSLEIRVISMSGSRFGRLIEGFRRSFASFRRAARPKPGAGRRATKGLAESANERKRHEHTHIDSLELVATHSLELIANHHSTDAHTARL